MLVKFVDQGFSEIPWNTAVLGPIQLPGLTDIFARLVIKEATRTPETRAGADPSEEQRDAVDCDTQVSFTERRSFPRVLKVCDFVFHLVLSPK